VTIADARALVLEAGATRAVLLPSHGMLVASLRHHGIESLRAIDDLPQAAQRGTPAGLPLLHPWANRLAGDRYRVGDREVILPTESDLLLRDANGLPLHGVPWSRLPWQLERHDTRTVHARLAWTRPEWRALFPFAHTLELHVTLDAGALTIAMVLHAEDARVPVSFGFHPYFGLPGARDGWHLRTPPLRWLDLDARKLPTGHARAFAGFDQPLAALDLDDGFALRAASGTCTLVAGAHALHLDLLEGFSHLQIYAPRGADFICLEPMAAPTNALLSGDNLRFAEPARPYRAAFRVRLG